MPYRILSLDGGGPWSLLQARALGEIFGPDCAGLDLLSRFDVVTCNSGGSIVIAGLLSGMSPRTIEAGFFADQAQLHRIFSPSTIDGSLPVDAARAAGISVYKYSTAAKLASLRTALGAVADRLVPDLPGLFAAPRRSPHFVFTAFDYDRNREQHFRSDPASPVAADTTDAPLTLAEAVNASSSAPIMYFDSPAETGAGTTRRRFWDGAVGGYNNPVLLGVSEALGYGVAPANIQVLSLGSAKVLQPLSVQFPDADPALTVPHTDWGLINDIGKISGAILDDPPDAASLHAYLAIGGRLPPRVGGRVQPQGTANFVRMNPLICPHWDGNTWQAPRNFQGATWTTLVQMPLVAIAPEQIALLQHLADCWIASDPADIPNQPVRFSWPYLTPELGHATFTQAAAIARSWFD
jgi:hypothetical protein